MRTEIPRRSGDISTINPGFVDLGQIDLLVAESFYGNRTDFIRTAIRNQLARHADALQQVVARKTLVLGLQHFSAADLRSPDATREMLRFFLGHVRQTVTTDGRQPGRPQPDPQSL